MRRISSFMLWVLLGVAVAIVPIACGSSSSNDDGPAQTVSDSAVDMTKT